MLRLDRESRRKDIQDTKDWFASTPGTAIVLICAALLVWSFLSGLF